MQFWIMKSEPSVFSIEDLQRLPQQRSRWEGVRNFQARNYLRTMQVGDRSFFYHSSCAPPGIVGVVEIVKSAYPDDTAWTQDSAYYDARATAENPIWVQVDVQLVTAWKSIVSLEELKSYRTELGEFSLLQRGNRLSIIPVTPAQWALIEGISASRMAF